MPAPDLAIPIGKSALMNAMEIASQIPLAWQIAQWQRLATQLEACQLAHAWLLSGQAGLGKALFARQFARRLLCMTPTGSQICGECRNCRLSAQGDHPDIHLLEPEQGARHIKIEQIRHLADQIVKTSHGGGAKIAIINHAQQLNVNAANALLKTLEEPTPDTYLLLVTESPGSLSATIRSRCQHLQFHVPDHEQARAWLQRMLAADADDPERLLSATNNRPLLALALAEAGTLAQRSAFIDKICLLLQGRQAATALVVEAGKLGELAAIECFIETSSILIKALLPEALQQRPAVAPALKDLVQALQGDNSGGSKARLQQLAAFYQSAVAALRQLQSSANPNPQLVVESLLWQWQQILR